MAEDVNIVGLNGVPSWATEDTLSKIHNILKKNVSGLQSSTLSAGKQGLSPDSLKALNEELKELNKGLEDSADLTERDNIYKQKAEAIYKQYFTTTGLLTTAALAASRAFEHMKSTMINNVNTFDKLHAAGVVTAGASEGTTDAFKSLGEMVVLASLRLERLGDIMSKYSAINAYGTDRFARSLRLASAPLVNLGFSSEAAAELMGAYVETLTGTTDIQNIRDADLAARSVAFGKSLTLLSLAAGVSREKLLAQAKSLNESIEANTVAAEYGSDAALNMSLYAASFKDPALGDAFVKMMSSKLPVLNTAFLNFAKGGLGGLGQQLMNFNKSLIGLSPEEMQRRTREFTLGLGDLDPLIVQQKQLAEAGVEAAAENLKYLVSLKQEQTRQKEISDEQYAAQQKSAAASANIATQWERIKTSFQQVFAPTVQILGWIGSGLEIVANAIESVATWFTKLDTAVSKLSAETFGTAIDGATSMFVALAASVASVVAGFKVITALIGVLRAARAASAATKVAATVSGGVGRIGGVVGTVADNLPGGRGRAPVNVAGGGKGSTAGSAISGILGGLGSGLGALLKGVGAGTGKLIEGVLTGLAAGLSAMGRSPAVIIGATQLSGAIAVLSLGIGAAAYVIGKTLPTLSAGLRGFAEIDGRNLIEVGKGIIAVAGGLAAFALGNMTASTGNIFASMATGFGKLFGADSPIDKIGRFAAMGESLAKAGTGMQALSAGLLTFASLDMPLIGRNAASLDKTLGKLGNVIELGKNAEQIQRAAKTSLLAVPQSTGVASAAEPAEQTRAKAASPKPSVPSRATAHEQPAPDGSINTLLAQQVSLTAALLTKMENSLSVSRDILKYTKLNT